MSMDVEQIRSDARKNFSLRDRLLGASSRRKTVTIYTDANVGAKLGYAEEGLYGQKTRRGLIGQLDELKSDLENRLRLLGEDDAEGIAQLQAEFDEKSSELIERIGVLRKELDSTALVFTIQSIPTVIVESIRRRAKKALDIKGKNIPEDREEEFAAEYACQFLAASVVDWTDKQSGETIEGLDLEDARELRGHLPVGQFLVLDTALGELSIEKAIGSSSTDDVDF